MKLQEPMGRHTTFKIGGPADFFVTIYEQEQLRQTLRLCDTSGVPCLFLGNGSNILVRDTGIRGAVLNLDGVFKNITLEGNTEILCGSGATVSALCAFAREHSLSGLEFAYGIPGSVGGAAFMNAGAYGGEMKDILISCQHMDKEGQIKLLMKEEMQLSYRHSVYEENKAMILFVRMRLNKGNKDTIAEKMESFMQRRKEKQPLEFPSAGSVFKRPQGYFAGALIEQCGLKGRRIGGAQVSEKHAGFIINRGNATCADVCQLIEEIQKTVQKETGILLEREVKIIG